MHFIKTFVPLLLASIAASAPLAKRSLLTDIASVSSDVATLTSAVTSFDGGLFQALALLVDFDNLKSAIDTATTAADASAALSKQFQDNLLLPALMNTRSRNGIYYI
jgi:hypothetical protein